MNTMELPPSVLTKSQKRDYSASWSEGGNRYRMIATVRYDDECGNGHNSFSITADIRENGREYMGGCCHDEIAKRIPELAPFLKWHLCGSDGPMHYLANVVYMAGDRDHNGKRKGERYHVLGHEEKRVTFGDFPISFEFDRLMIRFIESGPDWSKVEPVAVEHPPEKDGYKFGPKWTVTGLACEWYQCEFDRAEEAQEFIDACRRFSPVIKIYQDKFTKVGEGKARELDHARSCAIWPDATDEQLCAEPEVLKTALIERLPALMAEFKAAVEHFGFTY